jgi:endonuclease/exonuclease/phosphatase family metal-dependent hydrolase
MDGTGGLKALGDELALVPPETEPIGDTGEPDGEPLATRSQSKWSGRGRMLTIATAAIAIVAIGLTGWLKGTETSNRRLDQRIHTIGPPSRGRFRRALRSGVSAAATHRRPVAILATIALTVSLAGPAGADTQPPLRVMTYNLYLGANLVPIFTAPPDRVVAEVKEAWHHVRATNFRLRAEAIADLITEERPHLAGLQEVSLWQTAPIEDPTHLTTKYDFLTLLLRELDQNGTPYEAVAQNPFASAALPVSEDKLVRFTQRNVIIAPADRDEDTFTLTNPVSVVYGARIPLVILGQPFAITRGYATVDARFHGTWVRFVTTQPEAFGAVVRKLQAAELAAALATSPYDVIIAGDINSERHFTGDSYQILVGAGYTDVWLETMPGVEGFSASFGDDLVGPPDELDHTVDYVLRTTDGSVDGVGGSGEVVGEELEDRTTTGWWPSDHAGVVVSIGVGA